MEILVNENREQYEVASDTGYSWTKEQLEDYEESWARDHDDQV